MQTQQNKNSSKNRKLKIAISTFLLLIFIGFGIYIVSGLPSLEELENPVPYLASKVYSIDGELLGQFFIENRIETDIDSVPAHLINALIATEDRKFYSHWGVDMDRFIKAMIKNVLTFSKEGASTITQQLARNLYNLKEKNESDFGKVIRKVREWITAVQIEKNYTKKEILELYLNISYFGKSAYGIETASKIYFDKKAKDLSLTEGALLIALLKSSVVYDPERRMENAFRRRNVVLKNLYDMEYINEATFNRAKQERIVLARGQKVRLKNDAPHFMEHIRQQMEDMRERYGYDLYRDGLSIYTTIDLRMQRIANKVVADHLLEYQGIFNKNWNWDRNKSILNALVDKNIKTSPEYKAITGVAEKNNYYYKLKNDPSYVESIRAIESTIQAGFVIIDPKNGHIRVMVGGQNQEFAYGLNHVTQIRRQPGSSFKPLVYAVAVDNGYYPSYPLLNQKFDYEGWSPDNSDFEYGGYMTLREGLAKSVNVIAGRLTISEIAPPNQVVKYAKRMGINTALSPYPSIALGTSEVVPLELAAAYSTLANDGIYVKPISILRIEDKNGILLDEFNPEFREAISPQTSAIVTNMMQDVLSYGTGAGVRRYFHRPAAGKTGTTQDYADAWFVGFTPQLVGTVWVGFDDRRVKFNGWYGQGARAAMPIWAKFMAEAYAQIKLPLKYFELPSGVGSYEFCKDALDQGEYVLANEGCPVKIVDLAVTSKLPANCSIHGGTPRTNRGNTGESSW
ncbi:MAG: PBP1A family penicillin-binding protein [Ignavibacteriaceae bacterium]|nr:PBP1A family penicillin-binding protein [Ignavibacteriaceae bacterium]